MPKPHYYAKFDDSSGIAQQIVSKLEPPATAPEGYHELVEEDWAKLSGQPLKWKWNGSELVVA